MSLELKKAQPVTLRSVGLGEKWLQERIEEDPSILGLGELEVAAREHSQPVGGRIDFLLRNPAGDTYYEVEIMLGSLDESHIIRTIEYWDIERQRRPSFDHRAVIVAEQITTRFFNVLRLLNRAVPLIAIKLSAFQTDAMSIILHPVTVLDVIEEIPDDRSVALTERVDEAYWEKKSKSTLEVKDKIVSLLNSIQIEAHVTYNRHHLALGTTGYNFCWFNPRKSPKCFIEIKVITEVRDQIISDLQNVGIDASPRETRFVTFSTTAKDLEKHADIVIALLKQAEEYSHP